MTENSTSLSRPAYPQAWLHGWTADRRVNERCRDEMGLEHLGFQRALRPHGESVRKIAMQLEPRGVATKSNGRWYPTTVQRILRR